MKTLLIILLLIAIVGFIYFTRLYNDLVKKRNEVKNAFAQIDVQLTRRTDLIPNLVTAVKAYMHHEQTLLTAVTNAREHALTTLNVDRETRLQAETALSQILSRLQLRFEAYPELKADKLVQNLQEELKSTENRVAFARQYSNDAATDYNTTIAQFPNNLIAALLHFSPEPLLTLPTTQELTL